MFDQVTTASWLRAALLTTAGVLAVLTFAACTQTSGPTDAVASSPDQPVASAIEPTTEQTQSTPITEDNPPAAIGQPLPPAKTLAELAAAPVVEAAQPVSVSIDRLGLEETTVLTVGTLTNGEMEVPPPTQVGWYRFGPAPGQAGSAVLAGHIASEGLDGAFRHLDRVEPGDLITVGFDDGTSSVFAVKELFQVGKAALPFDRLFARSGAPQLALITCGGEFNYDARSYRDNVVVVADLVG